MVGSSLRLDRAFSEMNAATPRGVTAASDPPVIMMSDTPWRMLCVASPMAWAAEAQAVVMAELGPFSPKRIETLPAAALHISLGIVNGLTRSGPFSSSFFAPVSNSSIPPMPVPMIVPHRQGSSFWKSSPESLTASIVALSA